MDEQISFTSLTVLKNYHMYFVAVKSLLQKEITLVKDAFVKTNETHHSVILKEIDGKVFGCDVYHSPFHSHCLVYMLIPRKNYFEALMYNPQKKKYYLYHDHFFMRYAQRLNIEQKSFSEILQHFLVHNPITVYGRNTKKQGDTQHFMAVVRTGVVYGYIDSLHNIVNIRTLIDHYSLTQKKIVQAKKLRNILSRMENN